MNTFINVKHTFLLVIIGLLFNISSFLNQLVWLSTIGINNTKGTIQISHYVFFFVETKTLKELK
jgi:hypothetical protein